jgi:hypothetical protein
MGLLNRYGTKTPVPGSPAGAPAAGAVDPQSYYNQFKADPAFRGQPPSVIQANAIYKRTQEILADDPDITDDEVEEQLQDEGFYGSRK